MNKSKLKDIFENLLKDWEKSQSDLIQEFGAGEISEYEELSVMVKEYRNQFHDALN